MRTPSVLSKSVLALFAKALASKSRDAEVLVAELVP